MNVLNVSSKMGVWLAIKYLVAIGVGIGAGTKVTQAVILSDKHAKEDSERNASRYVGSKERGK